MLTCSKSIETEKRESFLLVKETVHKIGTLISYITMLSPVCIFIDGEFTLL